MPPPRRCSSSRHKSGGRSSDRRSRDEQRPVTPPPQKVCQESCDRGLPLLHPVRVGGQAMPHVLRFAGQGTQAEQAGNNLTNWNQPINISIDVPVRCGNQQETVVDLLSNSGKVTTDFKFFLIGALSIIFLLKFLIT